jgi:signal peptidase I
MAVAHNSVTNPSAAAGRGPFHVLFRVITVITGPWTRQNGATWLKIITVILLIRWAGCEPFSIPSGSMEPILHGDPRFLHGDRVGVNKLIYGPRVPFMNKRLFPLAEPKRWDIVVFKTLDKQAEHGTLVKRVVGLPGERVHIAEGKIWINGAPVEPPDPLRGVLHYTAELTQDEGYVQQFILHLAKTGARPALLNPVNFTVNNLYTQLARIRDRLGSADPASLTPEEIRALLAELTPVSLDICHQLFSMEQAAQYPLRYGVLEDDAYSLVPDNCYFVCGDNSGESIDGRYFGWLPNDHILGRAFCVWWPVTHRRDLTGFSKTWWGMGLINGVPAAFVLFECAALLRRRARRTGARPNRPAD